MKYVIGALLFEGHFIYFFSLQPSNVFAKVYRPGLLMENSGHLSQLKLFQHSDETLMMEIYKAGSQGRQA